MRSVRITIVIFLFLITAFVSLIWRCFYLQYYRSDHYYSISVEQNKKLVPLQPQRGAILDSRNNLLAASDRVQTIFAEPRVIEDPQMVSEMLGPNLGIEPSEMVKLIEQSQNPGYVKIKVGADEEDCMAARNYFGFGVESGWQRHYPGGPMSAHVVGFINNEQHGQGGIELQYDHDLAGSAGEDVFLIDKHRRSIGLKQQIAQVVDGAGIILTIDSAIQQFAYEELLAQYKSYQAEGAVAIVANPNTGAILAMVSLPQFDPEKFSTADPKTFRNRAVTDTFEPGSIMKPFTVAIALDEKVVTRNSMIYCEDGNYHGKGFGRIGEYGDHKYGNLSLREVLIKSSNVGTAKLGQKIGKKRLYEGLTRFGFGKMTGIESPGEVSGVLRSPDSWDGYSITRIPFGQEVTTTAIQAVRAFCILANGGRAVRPYLVKAMVDNQGKVIKVTRPAPPIGYVIDPDVAKWVVTNALVGVVNEKANGGTGWRAKLEKWQVFGKTGTANIALSNARGYSNTDYVASFIAGAPAENPKVVVLVMIRKPNKGLGKGYTGGAVASPVVGKIIERTLTYLEKVRI